MTHSVYTLLISLLLKKKYNFRFVAAMLSDAAAYALSLVTAGN